MKKTDHCYERGWRRYGFDNLTFKDKTLHGSDEPVSVSNAVNRGLNEAHISFAVIRPTDREAIGMHIHRDVPTDDDREEWYVIIDGEAEQTFSNGDVVRCHAGDLIDIYPGTGHSIRAVNGPCRIISITPKMFDYGHAAPDEYPKRFDPKIRIEEVDDVCCVVRAVCTECGAEWRRPEGAGGATALSAWAREHRHGEQGGAE
ncbi:MAG: cupin domain-containing protein [Clostridiales Family XIII bacterium]|jgi:mannose-6-phosphate isomerase-like protein (cupin superfamily)|nr:cupin domain-containing protein [Clostridiales Family XIII bacterium]